MAEERHITFDVNREIERFFDRSSLTADDAPRIVIYMGGVAVGKTTARKEQCAQGYVVVDAVEVFLHLSRGEYIPFPPPPELDSILKIIGALIAQRAVRERRSIVTEIIGADYGSARELIDAMTAAGYRVDVRFVECDLDTANRRNMARGDDCISAFYAERYHYEWLLFAARQ